MTREDAWTDQRLDEFSKRMDERFDGVDRRFEEVDRRFEEIDRRFESLETKMDNGFSALNARLDRLTIALIVGLFGVIASIVGSVVATQL